MKILKSKIDMAFSEASVEQALIDMRNECGRDVFVTTLIWNQREEGYHSKKIDLT